ncbi:putative Zn-binding protein involved in type VI secretion [Duganella sp. 1411]|uniref:PAAR-like domain-containing protein n=1 Tax=Duganella sp. 1411 TaxID=2806572 RepID=UPI001AEA4294|nr:PAAR-like domain-containing protein [Duganella sp. 1411]MBP1206141.1 putative Zn-binding protein involved in type VI secretion [Duganella sp. 1411]
MSNHNPVGARKDTAFKAISTAPSINMTPVGPSMVPIPYPTVQDLGNSINTAKTVNFNGKPAYLLDLTTQDRCTGDEAGTGKGVRSGTVGGEVKPVAGSRTVRIEGKHVVRHGDPCTMNGGNNPGVYVACSPPTAHEKPASAGTSSSPPVDQGEKNYSSQVVDALRQAGANVADAIASPLEGVKGALKGLANTIPETAEILIKGAADQQAQELNEAASLQMALGKRKLAASFSEVAQSTHASANAIELPKLVLTNSAQEGGNLVAIIVQLFAAGVGVAKFATKGASKLLNQGNAALPKTASTGDGVRILRSTSKARSVKVQDFLEKKWGKDAVDDALESKRSDPRLDALLTDDEYISIQAYTSNLYREINPTLRAGNLGEWAPVVDEATEGLAKMRGQGYLFKGRVRRDATFDLKQIDELFPEDGYFQDKAFVSSSKDVDGVFSGNTEIQIFSENGVDVRSLSQYGNEKEVLFSPGTKFKVTSRIIDPKNKHHVIVLREIE